MATRKQIRRERKRRVHGADATLENPRSANDEPRPSTTPRRRAVATTPALTNGAIMVGRRKVYPPSWRRSAMKIAAFVVVFGVLIFFVGGKHMTPAGVAIQALELVAIGLPAMYMMDRFVYRRALARSSPVSAAKR